MSAPLDVFFRVHLAAASSSNREKETMKRMLLVILAGIALVYWPHFGEPARAQTHTAQQQLAVDVYKELVEINTATATGDTARADEVIE